jgi:hypothetical protein
VSRDPVVIAARLAETVCAMCFGFALASTAWAPEGQEIIGYGFCAIAGCATIIAAVVGDMAQENAW